MVRRGMEDQTHRSALGAAKMIVATPMTVAASAARRYPDFDPRTSTLTPARGGQGVRAGVKVGNALRDVRGSTAEATARSTGVC